MKSAKPVNAVRIAWKSPYARTYSVGLLGWARSALDFYDGPSGEWNTFSKDL